MAEVTWWVAVAYGDQWGSSPDGTPRSLYARTVDMAHLPMEGDTVMYLSNDIEATVSRRYWNLDGTANLTFPKIIVDPNDNLANKMPLSETYWWSERDGNVIDRLLAAGWKEYQHG